MRGRLRCLDRAIHVTQELGVMYQQQARGKMINTLPKARIGPQLAHFLEYADFGLPATALLEKRVEPRAVRAQGAKIVIGAQLVFITRLQSLQEARVRLSLGQDSLKESRGI